MNREEADTVKAIIHEELMEYGHVDKISRLETLVREGAPKDPIIIREDVWIIVQTSFIAKCPPHTIDAKDLFLQWWLQCEKAYS